MKIEVTDVIEHEDGGATVKVEMDAEARECFICVGLRHALISAAIEATDIDLEEVAGRPAEPPTG